MKIETTKDGVVISDFNDIEVMKVAMKIEKDGNKAYKDVADKVNNEKLKKTLLRLAEDEDSHLNTFNAMYKDMLKEKGINPDDVDVEENLFTYADSGIFSGLEDMASIKSVKEIIKRSIDVEMKTILFYSEVFKKTENHQAKNKTKKIIEEEKMHYNILKSWEDICD